MTAEAKQLAGQAVHQLAEQLEAGKSDQLVAYLKAMGRFHQYSLGNQILIPLQRPEATRVAGLRTWNRLHRYVRAGEKGIAILAPLPVRRQRQRQKQKQKDSPPDGNAPGDASEIASAATADVEEVVMGFRAVHVFDLAQTEGAPLDEFTQVTGNPGEHLAKLHRVVQGRSISIHYSQVLGPTVQGFYHENKIVLATGLEPAEEFSVLVHEFAHAQLHRAESKPSKQVREVEAEAVAFVVGQAVGLDCGTASSDYIHLYDGKQETLLQSLKRIRDTSAQIIEALTGDLPEEAVTADAREPRVAVAA